MTIGENGVTEADLLVHDEAAADPYLAFMLSRMSWPDFPVPVGVLRARQPPDARPAHEDQIDDGVARRARATWRRCSTVGETWTVE